MTVLLIVVASSMGAALINQSQNVTRDADAKAGVLAARQSAETLLAEAEAYLRLQPEAPYRKVLPLEASRVCNFGPSAGQVVAADEVWPAECGTSWAYRGISGEWVGRQIEIEMPNLESPTMTVTARVRLSSGVAQTVTGTYTRASSNRASLAVTNLSTWLGAGTATANGAVYGVNVVATGWDDPTYLVGETVTGSRTGVIYASGDARKLLPEIPSPAGIGGAAYQVEELSCSASSAVASNAQQNVLCFVAGEAVTDNLGVALTVPSSAGYKVSASAGVLTVSTYASLDLSAGAEPSSTLLGSFLFPADGFIWFDQPVVLDGFTANDGTYYLSVGAPTIALGGEVSGQSSFYSAGELVVPGFESGTLTLNGNFSAGSGLSSKRASGSDSVTFNGSVALGQQVTDTACGSEVTPMNLCGYSSITYNPGDLYHGPGAAAALGGGWYRVDGSFASADGLASDWLRYGAGFASWSAMTGTDNTGRNTSATLDNFSSVDTDLVGGTSPAVSNLGAGNKTVIVLCSEGTVTDSATYTCDTETAVSFNTTETTFSFSDEAVVLEIVVFSNALTAGEIAEVSSVIAGRWGWKLLTSV